MKIKLAAVLVLVLGILGLIGAGLPRATTRVLPVDHAQELGNADAVALADPAKDAYGDPLPPGALARLGTRRLRHRDIRTVAFAPDGKTLAVGCSGDNAVHLWDMATRQEVRTLRRDGVHGFQSVAFAPDGKTLAAVGTETLPAKTKKRERIHVCRLWDVATGIEIGSFTGPTRAIAFAPDSKTLAQVTGNAIRLLDMVTGKELHTLMDRECGDVLAFAADGKTLASASGTGKIRLWEVASDNEIRTFLAHPQGRITSLAFAPDGRTLASGSSHTQGGQDQTDHTIRLWDVATGKEVRRFAGHLPGVTSVAYAPDGKTLVSGGHDLAVRLWDAATGTELQTLTRLHCKNVTTNSTSVAYAPDGKSVIAWGAWQTIRQWDVATGQEIRTLSGHRDSVWSLVYSPNGKILVSAGGGDQTILLWDVPAGREIRALMGHRHAVRTVAYAPDGQTLASSGLDQTVRLWDPASGREVRVLTGHSEPVAAVAYAPDGKTLATGGWDRTIRLWDVTTGRQIRAWTGHEGSVNTLAYALNGKALASGSTDGKIRLWDVATGQEIRTWTGHPSAVNALVVAPDGKTLASVGWNRTTRLWDLATGQEIRTWTGHWVLGLDFAPDGKTLAWGSMDDGTVHLCEVATGQEICAWKGHERCAHAVAFAPDGKTLASGSWDTTILVWDVYGGGRARELAAGDLQDYWTDLIDGDATRAHRAIGALAAAPAQAVPLLARQASMVEPPPEPQRLARLIADLDSKLFAVRQAAAVELERLGDSAEPSLRKALDSRPPLEVRRRLEELLAKMAGVNAVALTPGQLRWQRAIRVLELIGSPEAKEVLETLVQKTPSPRVRQDAQAALTRHCAALKSSHESDSFQKK